MGPSPPRAIHYLKPGVIHQARWMAIMASNIYAGKMILFSRVMHCDDDFIAKLARMNTFLILMHTPAWLKSSISADAPVDDLEYIHHLIDFRDVDQEVADVAKDKLTTTSGIYRRKLFYFHSSASMLV